MSFGLGGFAQIGNWVHDWATSAWKQDKAEGMMEDSQNFARDQQNSAQAFSERMFQTRYQNTVNDMKAAGLNPMLGYSQGASGQPSGTTGSAPGHHVPAFSQSGNTLAQSMLAASAMEVQKAQARNIDADTDLKKRQTLTEEVRPELLRQEIQESIAKTQKFLQDAKTGAASAGMMIQQTENFKAMIPHIEASIKQMQSMVNLNDAQIKNLASQTGKNYAEIKEIIQRVASNLPEAQRALLVLQSREKTLGLPEKETTSKLYTDPILGAASTLLRAFNPLSGLFYGGK